MVTTLLVALLALPPPGQVGRVVALSGNVTLTRNDIPAAIARGDYLQPGDTIDTGDDGSVRLLMRDKSVLALTARSSIRIAAYDVDPASKKRKARLTVMMGRLWAFVTEAVHPDASYEVSTNNAVAGVRGTELVFDVSEGGDSEVTVIKGEVDLASEGKQETLGARERGAVAEGAIALRSTTEEAIADIHKAVRPEQELDTAKAEKRLELLREKKKTTETEGPAPQLEDEDRGAERDDPGTGSAVLEDIEGSMDVGDRNFIEPDAPELFDPSTMGRVRINVRVGT